MFYQQWRSGKGYKCGRYAFLVYCGYCHETVFLPAKYLLYVTQNNLEIFTSSIQYKGQVRES